MEPRPFPFRFAPSYRRAAKLFGVTPEDSMVSLEDDELRATFGRWHVTTPIDNIASVELTGPYRFHRTAGPARYSLADHGLTFASNGDRGVYLVLYQPVPGLEPTGRVRHPNITLTVADCDGLVGAINEARSAAGTEPVRDAGPQG